MPTGAIRIAAPLVSPSLPASSGEHAVVDGIDGALGRRAEQVVAAARLDVALPVDQRLDPALVVEALAGFQQYAAEKQRLLGVVGDCPCRQPFRDGVILGRRDEPVDEAIGRSDLRR